MRFPASVFADQFRHQLRLCAASQYGVQVRASRGDVPVSNSRRRNWPRRIWGRGRHQKSQNGICPSSLSLILSFFKSSSHLIAIYTRTHIKSSSSSSSSPGHARRRKERKREREREREREFFFNRTRDSQKKKTITRGRIETSSSNKTTQHTTQQRSNEKAEQK